MKYIATTSVILGLASAAHAGGLDRSGQSIAALFEEGRYVELSFGGVSPSVSGTAAPGLGGFSSGSLLSGFGQFGGAYKADINEQWSYAIIYDQPFGANINYPTGTGFFAAGSVATLDSHALTGILRYRLNDNFSFHGGLRLQSVEADSTIPFVANYDVVGDRDIGLGYLVGAAYERPDIALRVALTYNSAIDYDIDTLETSDALGGPNASVTDFETPQSINLDFQTGIAADTLLFGTVRWAEWTEAGISPADFNLLTGGAPFLSFPDDVFTFTLGVGRKINDTWSVLGSVSYEKSEGSIQSNLRPTDGLTSVSLGAIYTRDNLKITTGIRYVNLGSATSAITGLNPAATFRDNDAVAFGVKFGYTF